MNIIDAAKALSEGENVRRKSWSYDVFISEIDSKIKFCGMRDGVVIRSNFYLLQFRLTSEDLLATDWEVVKE